jgi:hypothetical protein
MLRSEIICSLHGQSSLYAADGEGKNAQLNEAQCIVTVTANTQMVMTDEPSFGLLINVNN